MRLEFLRRLMARLRAREQQALKPLPPVIRSARRPVPTKPFRPKPDADSRRSQLL